jgi:valyl-tRNA synthetase
MSKSLGNSLDPIELIDEFGADVLRFTLVAFAAQGRDIRLSKGRFEGYYRFANKIWNAARFIFMNLEDFDANAAEVPFEKLSSSDRWILGRLDEATVKVRAALDDYYFNEAAGEVYKLLWNEFCDWYVEMAKRPLYAKENPEARLAAQQTLIRVFDGIMRLLHPFMPFLSEELWQKLPRPAYMGAREESLVIASFPKAGDIKVDPKAMERIEMVKEVVSAVRNIRGEMNVPPSRKIQVIVQGESAITSQLENELEILLALSSADRVDFIAAGAQKPKQCAAAVAAGFEIFIPLAGLVDLAEEEKRLRKEIDKLNADLCKVEGKLGNPSFVDKAPEEVVAKERGRAAELNENIAKLCASLKRILGE